MYIYKKYIYIYMYIIYCIKDLIVVFFLRGGSVETPKSF